MLRPAFLVALVASLALAGAGLALTAASRARADRAAAGAASGAPTRALRATAPSEAAPTAAGPTAASAPARPAPRHPAPPPAEVLRVRGGHTVALRDRPDGRVIAHLGDRTEFGSPAAMSVVARRGRWAAVPSSELANGRLGWVDTSDRGVDRRTTNVRLSVSLSHRRLELRVRGRLVRRVSVAIGRPGSSTPKGRFSITDKLAGAQYGPYYGCCVLALSGHQPNTPPGWTGGNRLAIHGTNAPSTIGTPASAGCLRAADEDLRVLMRRVPLGSPVVIRS